MKILITGGSGFIGQHLCRRLAAHGHELIVLSRRPRRVAKLLPEETRIVSSLDDIADDDAIDGIVNLAGESLFAGRWTERRKKVLFDSRIGVTQGLVGLVSRLQRKPAVMVSGSAVGFYGNRGADIIVESEPAGRGFLAEVCRAWEGAAKPAERAGLRVVTLRAGVVLSPQGGALGQMLLPFKMGAGGRLGSGKQYLSWIDLDDLVGLIYHALYDDKLRGPVNATAPNPVTNSVFTSALGRALGRPTIVPVPGLAVKAAFGEMGTELLLWGQRVIPQQATNAGFNFFYEGVEDSLRFQLGKME